MKCNGKYNKLTFDVSHVPSQDGDRGSPFNRAVAGSLVVDRGAAEQLVRTY